ncbi:MAG TPA: cytochrome c oxidase subunit 3 [Gemmatimonadales bacterium]|nr:cytochrome c oxidase subunit 3 [Gemmatimonadales bacterium]
MSESAVTLGAQAGARMEPSPYGIESKKLAIWLFIIADAATFGAMLFAYGYLRLANPDWSRPFAFWPTIANAVAMTVVLLVSSLTMVVAVGTAQAGQKATTVRWLGVTMLLGLVFAVLHLWEWSGMFAEGWRLFQNPLGGSALFGATFFSITGLSLLHVIAGIIALAVITRGYLRGRFDTGHIETTGLYWQFVNVVWMFVFPLVYLMNAR